MIIVRDTSKKSKEEDNKDNKDKEKRESKLSKIINDPVIYSTAAGANLLYHGPKLSKMLIKDGGSKFLDDLDKGRGNDDKVTEKLKKKAKDVGIKLAYDEDFDNSAYLGGAKITGKIFKKLNAKPKVKEYLNKTTGGDIYDLIGDGLGMSRKNAEEYGNDTIVMGLGSNNSTVLAHEMGHAAMSKKGRSRDLIGKAAHTPVGLILNQPVKLTTNHDKKIRNTASAGFLGAGIIHGIKASKKEEAGDIKGANKEKRKGLIRSSIMVAPGLIQEAAASRKGLKYLKEAGASKETLKDSRKLLRHAYATYVGASIKPIALEGAGTGLGYAGHKLVTRLKKKKEQPKKEQEDKNKSNSD